MCAREVSGLGGGGRVPAFLIGLARACAPSRHGFLGVRLGELLAPRLLLATPKQATLERRVIPRPWQPVQRSREQPTADVMRASFRAVDL